MNSLLKIGIAAALAGALYFGYSYLKNAASTFGFSIKGYGIPSMSNWVLSLPISVQFKNPTPADINLDNLSTTIYILKDNSWAQAATIDQPLDVASGTTDQTIVANIDITSLFGGSLVDTLASIGSILKNKMVQIRADVVADYGPISIPESFNQTVALPI